MMGSDQVLIAKMGLDVNRPFKIAKLRGGYYDQEGLKQYDGFPETGIEVVVGPAHFVPSALGIRAHATGQVLGSVPKVPIQILHHFLDCADLVKELKPVGKQDAVQ